MNKRLILMALLAREIRKKRNLRVRRFYVRDIFQKRRENGEKVLVQELALDPEYHHRYFRMDKPNFDEILQKIKCKLHHFSTHRFPISPIERLAITIRYLATGNSQISLAFNYRMSPSSVSQVVRETMQVICDTFEKEYLKSPTEEDWKKYAQEFKSKWNYPNACGSMDGKHVRIKNPNRGGSKFYNYKNFFSIVLFAIVDANHRFVCVDIGAPGSSSDGDILSRSTIGNALSNSTIGLPEPAPIIENGPKIPHVILGDEGFPLKSYLMRPYTGKYLDHEFRVYNYRLSRARMVVENSFGLLAARWRIFHSTIEAYQETAKLIIRTCIILHNFLLGKNDSIVRADSHDNGNVIQGNWREMVEGDTGITNLGQVGSNNYSLEAHAIREEFKNYFNNEGQVEWQNRFVNLGYD